MSVFDIYNMEIGLKNAETGTFGLKKGYPKL